MTEILTKKHKKVKKALLTAKQKQFCREYVMRKDNQKEAARAAYDVSNERSAADIGRDLLKDPRIICYIEYVRQEIETTIPNTMTWLIEKGAQGVELAIRKEQPAALAKCLEVLDKMRGTGRRHHSFNIAHYDTMREKLDVIYHALAEGEIGTDQFVALTQSVKNVEQEQLVEEVEKMKEQFRAEENDQDK